MCLCTSVMPELVCQPARQGKSCSYQCNNVVGLGFFSARFTRAAIGGVDIVRTRRYLFAETSDLSSILVIFNV